VDDCRLGIPGCGLGIARPTSSGSLCSNRRLVTGRGSGQKVGRICCKASYHNGAPVDPAQIPPEDARFPFPITCTEGFTG